MIDLLISFVELLAWLIGLFVTQLLLLPGPVWGIIVVLLLSGLIYRWAWNNAIDAVWSSDIQRANDARRQRRR